MKSAYTKNRLKRDIARWKRRRVKIIAVAGRRKAGKDVFVAHLMKNYPGFRHVRIAEAPLLIARVLDLPPDREIYHALFGVNALLRPIIGESAFKRRAARVIDKTNPRLAVVEALRTEEEYREFVKKRGGILIGIQAAPEARYERVLIDAGRLRDKQDEAKLTFKEFMGDPKKKTGEHRPIEREIGRIIRRAHFVLENNYRRKAPFHRDIDEAMKSLGLKRRIK